MESFGNLDWWRTGHLNAAESSQRHAPNPHQLIGENTVNKNQGLGCTNIRAPRARYGKNAAAVLESSSSDELQGTPYRNWTRFNRLPDLCIQDLSLSSPFEEDLVMIQNWFTSIAPSEAVFALRYLVSSLPQSITRAADLCCAADTQQAYTPPYSPQSASSNSPRTKSAGVIGQNRVNIDDSTVVDTGLWSWHSPSTETPSSPLPRPLSSAQWQICDQRENEALARPVSAFENRRFLQNRTNNHSTLRNGSFRGSIVTYDESVGPGAAYSDGNLHLFKSEKAPSPVDKRFNSPWANASTSKSPLNSPLRSDYGRPMYPSSGGSSQQHIYSNQVGNCRSPSAPPRNALSPDVSLKNEKGRIPERVDFELLNDIPAWLRSLRLHKYTGIFWPLDEYCTKEFSPQLTGNRKFWNWREMIELTDEDLDQMGVKALGARRKMLKFFELIKSQLP